MAKRTKKTGVSNQHGNIVMKGDCLLKKGDGIYEMTGRWDGSYVLKKQNGRPDDMLIYTPVELNGMIGNGDLVKV